MGHASPGRGRPRRLPCVHWTIPVLEIGKRIGRYHLDRDTRFLPNFRVTVIWGAGCARSRVYYMIDPGLFTRGDYINSTCQRKYMPQWSPDLVGRVKYLVLTTQNHHPALFSKPWQIHPQARFLIPHTINTPKCYFQPRLVFRLLGQLDQNNVKLCPVGMVEREPESG